MGVPPICARICSRVCPWASSQSPGRQLETTAAAPKAPAARRKSRRDVMRSIIGREYLLSTASLLLLEQTVQVVAHAPPNLVAERTSRRGQHVDGDRRS